MLHVAGSDPATGQPVDHWIADGVFVEAPADRGAATVTLTGWVTPGFVDAHCHVGYSRDGWPTLAGGAGSRPGRTSPPG